MMTRLMQSYKVLLVLSAYLVVVLLMGVVGIRLGLALGIRYLHQALLWVVLGWG
jgi:hypothetical protein